MPASRPISSAKPQRGLGAVAAVALGLATTVTVLGQGTLPPIEIVDLSIPSPLTTIPGDPVAGRLTVRDTSTASCLICHDMPIPEDPNHGTFGPPLAGAGSRYSAAELRLRLVDPKVINPDTVMPAYYKVDGLHRIDLPFQGRTIYSAQQIEDVVAYLMTLTDQAEAVSP